MQVFVKSSTGYTPVFIYTHSMPQRKGPVGKTTFARWFHKNRVFRCKTISQLSEDLGITRYYLTGFETGILIPNEQQLDVLANYFGITIGSLSKLIVSAKG